MVKKNREIEINEENVFCNDKLQRKIEIENLSSLIISTKEALTLSINAEWGAGKTTFVKLWKSHLKRTHEIDSIYFSAWEDDFSKEPLISILGELNKYIEDNFKSNDDVKENFDKVKDFGVKILKNALPAFAKGLTAGFLDYDKGFENGIGAITEEATKSIIDNYSQEKSYIVEFKEQMSSLLKEIGNDKPFVFFVDELDRCRPLYAIELLEKVKHLFGINGLIFVFSIDKKQLSESIKSQYGNIDTPSYLKRFIDLEYNLANPDKDVFCDYLYNEYNLDKIINSKEIKDVQKYSLDHRGMFKYIVRLLNLTLREIEQAFIKIDIIFKTIEPRFYESHFRVIVFFVLLKIKREDLYFGLISKTMTKEEILNQIFSNNITHDEAKRFNVIIKSMVLSTSVSNLEWNKIIEHEEKRLEGMDTASELYDIQKWLVELLQCGYNSRGGYPLRSLVNTVIKKVEFAEQFNFEGIA